MTTDDTSEGGPIWDPFSSDDPEIKFLIATIVTAAIMLTERPDDPVAIRTLLTAAVRLREVVNERQK